MSRKDLYTNGVFHVTDMEKCPVRMLGGNVLNSTPVVVEDIPGQKIIVFGDIDILIDEEEWKRFRNEGMDALIDYILDNAYIVIDTYGTVYRCGVMHNEMSVSDERMKELSGITGLESLRMKLPERKVRLLKFVGWLTGRWMK